MTRRWQPKADVTDPEVVVLPDADALAADVAARVLGALADAQLDGGRARLALTAGSIMETVWGELAQSRAATTVDWSGVDVFWGDERFVPAGTADRNDAPANRILFSAAPFVAARRFPMPASDGSYGADLDAAAAGYAATLAAARRHTDLGTVPNFDIVLLGIGPDGHCCSLFPEHPGVRDSSSSVIPVRNSPKPPSERISLSFDGLNSAKEIWVVASGSGKADAVRRALGGADRVQVPSAGARGTERTIWFLDTEAAADLPN
jgi:6-phosphogluconolactonase